MFDEVNRVKDYTPARSVTSNHEMIDIDQPIEGEETM